MFIHTETFFFLLIREFEILKGLVLVHVGGFISKLIIIVHIVHSRMHIIHIISSDIGVFFVKCAPKVLIFKVICLVII